MVPRCSTHRRLTNRVRSCERAFRARIDPSTRGRSCPQADRRHRPSQRNVSRQPCPASLPVYTSRRQDCRTEYRPIAPPMTATPNQRITANRRPDVSGNLSAIIADDRAFPAALPSIATAAVINSAGTIHHFGTFCQRKQIHCRLCPNGQSLCAAARSIDNRLMSKHPAHHEPTNRIGSDASAARKPVSQPGLRKTARRSN